MVVNSREDVTANSASAASRTRACRASHDALQRGAPRCLRELDITLMKELDDEGRSSYELWSEKALLLTICDHYKRWDMREGACAS